MGSLLKSVEEDVNDHHSKKKVQTILPKKKSGQA